LARVAIFAKEVQDDPRLYGENIASQFERGGNSGRGSKSGVAEIFPWGAGLATRYLIEEVPAGIDALGPENKLIFMTGMLTGTASASASRYSVVAKSPLTGILGTAIRVGILVRNLKKADLMASSLKVSRLNLFIWRLLMGKPGCMMHFIFGEKLFPKPKVYCRTK